MSTASTTKVYRITNSNSGHVLGLFRGVDIDAAAEALAKDAGYASYDEMSDALSEDDEDFDDGDLLYEEVLRLEGSEAIHFAERHGLTLSKAADPTEDARDGLTPDEAQRIDPSLIYLVC